MPPAVARVSCDGQEHELRWAAGELRAPGHPDLESEQILSALAGQRLSCLDVLDAWAVHAEDLRVLVLASRGPADPVAVRLDEPGPRAGPAGPAGAATMQRRRAAVTAVLGGGARGVRGTQDALATLLSLGGPMQARLTATVAAAWQERLPRRGRARGPQCAGRRMRLRSRRPGRRCTPRCTAGWWPPCGPGPGGRTSGSR